MFHSNVSLPEGRSDRRSCVRNPSQKSFPGDPGSVASSSSATELLQSAYNAAEEDREFECSCSLAGNGWEWHKFLRKLRPCSQAACEVVTTRPKDETAEEKKARKASVKA